MQHAVSWVEMRIILQDGSSPTKVMSAALCVLDARRSQGLHGLPDELLLMVLEHVAKLPRLALRRVCRRMYYLDHIALPDLRADDRSRFKTALHRDAFVRACQEDAVGLRSRRLGWGVALCSSCQVHHVWAKFTAAQLGRETATRQCINSGREILICGDISVTLLDLSRAWVQLEQPVHEEDDPKIKRRHLLYRNHGREMRAPRPAEIVHLPRVQFNLHKGHQSSEISISQSFRFDTRRSTLEQLKGLDMQLCAHLWSSDDIIQEAFSRRNHGGELNTSSLLWDVVQYRVQSGERNCNMLCYFHQEPYPAFLDLPSSLEDLGHFRLLFSVVRCRLPFPFEANDQSWLACSMPWEVDYKTARVCHRVEKRKRRIVRYCCSYGKCEDWYSWWGPRSLVM